MDDKPCADCGMALSEDETWVCSECCAFYSMLDPNFKMESGDD